MNRADIALGNLSNTSKSIGHRSPSGLSDQLHVELIALNEDVSSDQRRGGINLEQIIDQLWSDPGISDEISNQRARADGFSTSHGYQSKTASFKHLKQFVLGTDASTMFWCQKMTPELLNNFKTSYLKIFYFYLCTNFY